MNVMWILDLHACSWNYYKRKKRIDDSLHNGVQLHIYQTIFNGIVG